MKQVLVGIIVSVLLLSSQQLLAQEQGQSMHCQLGDAVRVVEVVYPKGGELPCEVQYTKDGVTAVLWQASNEAGYCQQQAASFADKLRGYGFECVAMPAANKAETGDASQ